MHTFVPMHGEMQNLNCGFSSKGFAKSRHVAQQPATRHSPAAWRPSVPRLTARGLQWPSGLEAQSWFSGVFCPVLNPRSCTDPHRVWACKMEVRSSCMTPWNVLSIERLSLALIFCPRRWSSISSTDLLPLALISVCPLHWSSVLSTDLLLLALMNC